MSRGPTLPSRRFGLPLDGSVCEIVSATERPLDGRRMARMAMQCRSSDRATSSLTTTSAPRVGFMQQSTCVADRRSSARPTPARP